MDKSKKNLYINGRTRKMKTIERRVIYTLKMDKSRRNASKYKMSYNKERERK